MNGCAREMFGTPPEPHFNLATSCLTRDLLSEWLQVLAEENAKQLQSKNVGIFKSNECAADFFLICERLTLPAEAKYLGMELFDSFMSQHVKDLFEHVKAGAGDKHSAWREIQDSVCKQIHLRMVSCCQVASKLTTHYKIITTRKAQGLLSKMGHSFTCDSVLQSEIRVMKTLKFRVMVANPLLYVETLLEVLGYNDGSYNVKVLHGVCLDVLDVVYLRFNLIYERLRQFYRSNGQLDRVQSKAREKDLMLIAVAVIGCAGYITSKQNPDKVICDLAQVTKIPAGDIANFSCVLVDLTLEDENSSK